MRHYNAVQFVDALTANTRIGSLVAVRWPGYIKTRTRRVVVMTMHERAARDVEDLAHAHHLGTVTTRPDDGSYVVGVTGFHVAKRAEVR